MRKLIVLLTLLCSHQVFAEPLPLLVHQFAANLRIVLSQDAECNDKPGYRASAQRIDGLYIPGCWTEEPDHPELIRIDWHNGDFSILPREGFTPVKSK